MDSGAVASRSLLGTFAYSVANGVRPVPGERRRPAGAPAGMDQRVHRAAPAPAASSSGPNSSTITRSAPSVGGRIEGPAAEPQPFLEKVERPHVARLVPAHGQTETARRCADPTHRIRSDAHPDRSTEPEARPHGNRAASPCRRVSQPRWSCRCVFGPRPQEEHHAGHNLSDSGIAQDARDNRKRPQPDGQSGDAPGDSDAGASPKGMVE